ncbi:hypothetical protein KKH27_13695, partial [bacterium]|nr:hypothetical protein [bacterium]MBU1983501.1 hypothetical protein [bacterium]
LRATSRMFRSFQNISLVWGGVSDSVKAIDIPGSLFDVRVQYQLILDDLTPVIGFARFTLYKEEDDRFRIVLWQDDV